MAMKKRAAVAGKTHSQAKSAKRGKRAKTARAAATKKTDRTPKTAMTAKTAKTAKQPSIRVRMYRQGLGDCFLVSFFTGSKPAHMLIDCGTLGATTTGVKMSTVVADIARETQGHLDLLVVTHEHRDHVSGFLTERAAFEAFTVDHVWAAWTENAKDPLAQEIAKYKGDLVTSIAMAMNALDRLPIARDEHESDKVRRAGVRQILGFVGDVPAAEGAPLAAGLAKTVHDAMTYATTRAGDAVSFLKPGQHLEPSWIPGVRFYVLGPPRDKKAIGTMGEHGSTDLYSLAAQSAGDLTRCARFGAAPPGLTAFLSGLEAPDREEFVRSLPFDPRFRIEDDATGLWEDQFGPYFEKRDAWRRIDRDWLSSTGEFALQLDSYTNNTSLVLAMELIEDGRVLLFPADAQLGNWLSWDGPTWKVPDDRGRDREVKAADLLARTVFYKVGHHSSHNATASKRGLELMERDDLVAFIPVDRAVAIKKTPPWLMPADALYARLVEKTQGRVLRSDTGWPESSDRPKGITAASWADKRKKASASVMVKDLYVDYLLR
jgi:hypothetical protein